MVWISGQQLQGGKYIIEQVLGQGGFGITYKALHALLNNLVVIKTPNESLRNDPEYPKYVKRFINEGQRLEKLLETQHPNIVRVRDLFNEGGTYCLVMDFVSGESLFELVKQWGKLPQAEAVQYIHQIGDALRIVHQAGLVHRDAHPGNIMVQQDGKAVLIDFGIAGETIPTTVSSKVFANPAFAPYEQMRGGREPSVDIYSVAASLYYAVTGQFPEASLDRKIYNIPLIPPQQHIPSISDELNQAILKGLELEAKDRPQSMQEWLEMLTPKPIAIIWSVGFELQNGKYTIERILSQGGFGIAYLAKNDTGESIVIKTLNETVQLRPDFAKFQEDFVKEAFRLAKCTHPHIVKVNDVFQEGQLWCMAMEYIEGEHLADRVVNRGVLSEAEALGYIQQVGEALTVVHNSGLLHRDVKPANIILRSNQLEAVLIDFGIAREFTPNVTKLHTANLSHCFAPIEQYQSVAKRGAYTDVYALAATLYFLLTKTLPQPAMIRASGTVLKEPKNINSSVSDRVNQAIIKGIELEPENRPQTMQEWLELLKEPTVSTPPPPPKIPDVDYLISDRNIDYQKLRNLLRDGKWKEANEETLVVMLEASGRKNKGWLDIESIKNFPRTDLRTIDQLWVKYSQGKFGLSVQKHIWESVGGKLDAKHEIAVEFGKKVGWYVDSKWINKDQLQLTIINAKQGYFPSVFYVGLYDNSYQNWAGLFTGLFTLGLVLFSIIVLAGLLYFLVEFLSGLPTSIEYSVYWYLLLIAIGCFLVILELTRLGWRTTMKAYAALFARSDL